MRSKLDGGSAIEALSQSGRPGDTPPIVCKTGGVTGVEGPDPKALDEDVHCSGCGLLIVEDQP
jgi:hypothetical protein